MFSSISSFDISFNTIFLPVTNFKSCIAYLFSSSIPMVNKSSFNSIGNKLYFLASFSGTNIDKSFSDDIILITSISKLIKYILRLSTIYFIFIQDLTYYFMQKNKSYDIEIFFISFHSFIIYLFIFIF